MFPTELVLLKDPVLKYIFYKKYIEGKLKTFEFLSQYKVSKEQIKLRTIETYVPEEKGPIILLAEHCSCYMINFSKSLNVYNLFFLKDSLPKLI
jgi:uncharacterized protein with von Willebrand factor type A (vWA) domain